MYLRYKEMINPSRSITITRGVVGKKRRWRESAQWVGSVSVIQWRPSKSSYKTTLVDHRGFVNLHVLISSLFKYVMKGGSLQNITVTSLWQQEDKVKLFVIKGKIYLDIRPKIEPFYEPQDEKHFATVRQRGGKRRVLHTFFNFLTAPVTADLRRSSSSVVPGMWQNFPNSCHTGTSA
ncbi:hypothetical protein J6590_106137 [Homalodisca vitripennis]|nr:hypothetical protein J6590_106137 [Homalodisca vitripennis]